MTGRTYPKTIGEAEGWTKVTVLLLLHKDGWLRHGHVLALVLSELKLSLAGLSAAVASKHARTVGAASSDIIHLEHSCTKGVANGDKKHSMVH
nr:unnamed protein product [Digitaria exilis]